MSMEKALVPLSFVDARRSDDNSIPLHHVVQEVPNVTYLSLVLYACEADAMVSADCQLLVSKLDINGGATARLVGSDICKIPKPVSLKFSSLP
jgi:hypothetical protein